MIDEIKKEIKTTCMVYLITPCPEFMRKDTRDEEEIRADVATTLKLIDKILDKYSTQPDYKSAWEEMKNDLGISDEDIHTYETMQELSKKYGLEEDL